jgi:hypothetical protein
VVLGSRLGDVVGSLLGLVLGLAVGSLLGLVLGIPEGSLLGLALGVVEGLALLLGGVLGVTLGRDIVTGALVHNLLDFFLVVVFFVFFLFFTCLVKIVLFVMPLPGNLFVVTTLLVVTFFLFVVWRSLGLQALNPCCL